MRTPPKQASKPAAKHGPNRLAKPVKPKKEPAPGLNLVAMQLAFETTPATLENIGQQFGCTKGRVSQLAKEHGWKRGANIDRARAKAEAKVQDAQARDAQVEANTEAAVDATAQIMADVILRERRDVRGMTELASRMFAELQASQSEAEALVKKPVDGKKAPALSERIDDLRKLGNTVDTLVKLERNVFGITPDTPIDPSKRIEEAIDNGMASLKAKFAQVLGA